MKNACEIISDIYINYKKGLIIIKNNPKNFADFPEAGKGEYFWSMIMKDHNFEGCYGASWIITPEEADSLHAQVEKDQVNPPGYQISGESSLFAKSSSQSGHNCFTWARAKIKSHSQSEYPT